MTFDLEKARDAAKPRSWQITEDRVTAIDQGLRFLEWSNAKNGSVETKKHIATLQTMLEEASGQQPTWVSATPAPRGFHETA